VCSSDLTLVDNSTPTLISFPGGETIRNVAAGFAHSLAVTTTGQVFAWGSNEGGKLGDGTIANRSTPKILRFVIASFSIRVDEYLTVTYDEAISLPNPILEGHEFIGWYMDEAFTIPYNLTTMPANNVVLYALFASNNN
jgi:uncharacterized repeat protein (TIGR02543 family)